MYNCSFDVGEPSNLERQALPLRRQVTPDLPTVTILGIMEAEAGNRMQSVVKQAGNNTGVNGKVTLGKTSPRKVS